MRKQVYVICICVYLCSLHAEIKINTNWTPDSDKEFVSSTFSDWYIDKDCKTIGGAPIITAQCQGYHYPNEICCGDITQAKLLAFVQNKSPEPVEKKVELDAEQLQKNVSDILMRINQLTGVPN